MSTKNTRTVTVRNYKREEQNWGNGLSSVALERITLDWTGRKEPRWHNEGSDGEWYRVNVWDRDDGEIDYYENVLKEAVANGLNPELKY